MFLLFLSKKLHHLEWVDQVVSFPPCDVLVE